MRREQLLGKGYSSLHSTKHNLKIIVPKSEGGGEEGRWSKPELFRVTSLSSRCRVQSLPVGFFTQCFVLSW